MMARFEKEEKNVCKILLDKILFFHFIALILNSDLFFFWPYTVPQSSKPKLKQNNIFITQLKLLTLHHISLFP